MSGGSDRFVVHTPIISALREQVCCFLKELEKPYSTHSRIAVCEILRVNTAALQTQGHGEGAYKTEKCRSIIGEFCFLPVEQVVHLTCFL